MHNNMRKCLSMQQGATVELVDKCKCNSAQNANLHQGNATWGPHRQRYSYRLEKNEGKECVVHQCMQTMSENMSTCTLKKASMPRVGPHTQPPRFVLRVQTWTRTDYRRAKGPYAAQRHQCTRSTRRFHHPYQYV